MKHSFLLFILAVTALTFSSCRKTQSFAHKEVKLGLSADTIFLDTVFSQIGSSTRMLRVNNPTNEDIYIDRIYLAKGESSYYRLNVNGISTKDISNVELLANDSIVILIEVTADVGQSIELLYTDSIVFKTLGNVQDVDLVTLAKDAHFYYPTNELQLSDNITIPYSVLDCNTTWGPDKPHVVYGYVVVDDGCTLTIQPGTEVHFHYGSGLWVFTGGTLKIDPDNLGHIENNPVIIQGDRLEPDYEDVAGQWGGILGGIFLQTGSYNNVIQNTLIKNSTVALRVDSTDAFVPNLFLSNTQILNSSRVGIYGGYSFIEAENVVVGNSGVYSLYALGGRYSFTHCTFANYAISSRNTPSIGLFNYYELSDGSRSTRDIVSAQFKNTIVYGSKQVEFGVGYEPSAALNFNFNTCILRLQENPIDQAFDRLDPTLFTNCTLDENPMFVNYQAFNYKLDSISPAIDAANMNFAQQVPLDILKVDRLTSPDIGAYER